MDPNQDDQNGQNPQTPSDDSSAPVNPSPDPVSAPEPMATPDPVSAPEPSPATEVPGDGGMGEVPPPPPVVEEPQGVPMGDDHTMPGSDEPAGDASPAA